MKAIYTIKCCDITIYIDSFYVRQQKNTLVLQFNQKNNLGKH